MSPEETDPNPQAKDPTLRQLHELYRNVGRLIALHEASKAPRIFVDGDIEVAWPEPVKQEIEARITEQINETSVLIQGLRNGKTVDRDKRQ